MTSAASRTSRISAAIGATIVAPIVDVLDVDGVVQRINLEDALSRVDLDALLARVDVNALLDRVDLNRHILRVDLDRVLERSNLPAIVARNSSGVFGVAIDGARAQVVKADAAFQRLGRCARCREEPWELPPMPGGSGGGGGQGGGANAIEASLSLSAASSLSNSSSASAASSPHPPPRSRPAASASARRPLDLDASTSAPSNPNRSLLLALEAQGRYAGILARCIANAVDFFIVVTVFTIFLVLIETLINRLSPHNQKEFNPQTDWPYYPVFLYLWQLLYKAGSLAVTGGRTIGLALLGLRVVNSRDGTRVGPLRALCRTAVEPLSTITVVGALMGWARRDGRMLHDLLARTGVCYSWDARLAYLRQRAFDEMDEKQNV